MRKLAAIIGCLACLAAQGAGAPGQAPVRAYVLTLPHPKSIVASDVGITENGAPVTKLSVVPANAAGSTGTLLMIDASDSMRGSPIAAAMSAARGFAARRNPGQDLALMTFNSRTNILLPFTHDGAQIAAAMSQPPRLANGTHIFDAVQDAVALVDRATLRTATIILLSDGADVGSRATASQAAASLRSRHIRLFAVGIQSKAFDAGALSRLARAGNGSLAVATSLTSLGPIYDKLGFKLVAGYTGQERPCPDADRRVQLPSRGGVSNASTCPRDPRPRCSFAGSARAAVVGADGRGRPRVRVPRVLRGPPHPRGAGRERPNTGGRIRLGNPRR